MLGSMTGVLEKNRLVGLRKCKLDRDLGSDCTLEKTSWFARAQGFAVLVVWGTSVDAVLVIVETFMVLGTELPPEGGTTNGAAGRCVC